MNNIFADCDFLELIGVNDSPFKSILNLSKIYCKLDDFRGNLKGLQNYFKKWRVSIKEAGLPVDIMEDIQDDFFYVTGETVTPDINGREYTNIRLFLHTKNFNKHKFKTAESWNQFKFTFIQLLAHEFVHFRQAHNAGDEMKVRILSHKKSKDEKIQSDREYFADIYETEAYGHCMYLETLWYPCPYKDFKKRMHRTGIYRLLLETYGGDHTSKVIQATKKQAIKWKLKYEKHLKHEKG